MKFDKDAGALLKRVLKEWIESHSENGVMSSEMMKLWVELCSAIDKKVLFWERLPKSEVDEVGLWWFGESILLAWCNICGEVDDCIAKIVRKVACEREIVDTGMGTSKMTMSKAVNICERCRFGKTIKRDQELNYIGNVVVCNSPSGDVFDDFWLQGECKMFEKKNEAKI